MPRVACPHCGHKFDTKSKLVLVSCGGCGLKFKNPHGEKHLVKV